MSVPYGVYFIQTPDNVPRALAWGDLDSNTVTLAKKSPWCCAPARDTNVFLELWLVEPLTTCGATCTIRNLKNGKYMILDDEDSIILDDSAMDASEQWNIVPSCERIKGLQAYGICPVNSEDASNICADFLGFTGSTDRDIVLKKHYQPWIFQRLSRSGGEIQKVVSQNWSTNDSVPNIFRSYQSDTEYLILSRGLWSLIWEDYKEHGFMSNVWTDIPKQREWRPDIYDCDDFATVFKAAVAVWGEKNIRVDGIAILCGVMLGQPRPWVKDGEAHAYNFTLSDENFNDPADKHRRIQYFQAEIGKFENDEGYHYYPVVAYF
ncbi:hypothetical protein EV702DRAFT_380632 [Suillus placidus]|uniref:Agglutinin C-terminal domain-containing protein n=1 Tax=Suillus placidus TaxID=48579 RepID=A0A9P7A681_9AGAM|nr:hypothetical protein EV702DRAFT_380632 [Suillus placidus]